MQFKTYSASQIRGLIDLARPKPTLFLDKFYPGNLRSDTDIIHIESLPNKGRKLAPRVSPLAPGRPIGNRGTSVQTFRPTYLKYSTPVDADGPVDTTPVDLFSVNYVSDPEQRRINERNRILIEQTEDTYQTWEWMGAMAAIHGYVDTSYIGKPEQRVYFGRDPSLTVTKTDGTYWGQNNVSILEDLDSWRRLMHAAPGGMAGSFAIAGPAVQDEINRSMRKGELKDLIDTRYGPDGTTLTRGLVDVDDISFMGRISGKMELYGYSAKFEDKNQLGEIFEHQPLGDNEIAIFAKNIEGTKAFGRIRDDDAGNKPIPLHIKNYRSMQNDRNVEHIVAQSAPIMIPGAPNRTFKATVLPAQ